MNSKRPLAKDVTPQCSKDRRFASVERLLYYEVLKFAKETGMDAADLLSAAQIKLAAHLDKWQPNKAALTTYARLLVRSAMLDEFRKRKVRAAPSVDDVPEPTYAPSTYCRLTELLEGLSGDAAVVVSLLLGDGARMAAAGFCDGQIAARMGVPDQVAAVKAFAKRALAAMGWSDKQFRLAFASAESALYGGGDADAHEASGRRRAGTRKAGRSSNTRR
jgi:DNA-directed RNA polymerase specialized sigma24 family protein